MPPATVAAFSAVSAITKRAPESRTIHSICSADEVAYTGTLWPPAAQIAKSSTVHS